MIYRVTFISVSIFYLFCVSGSYNTCGQFIYKGYVPKLNDSSKILKIIELTSTNQLFCTTYCLRNQHCNGIEVCLESGIVKCILAKGLQEPGSTPSANCRRYQFDDVCEEGSYLDRIDNYCICGIGCTCEGINTLLLNSSEIKIPCHFSSGYFWTVIQRRLDGSVAFTRGWNDYKIGFGALNSEFWLGNDLIHALTANGYVILRIEMEDFTGSKRHAEYSSFSISDESDNYRLRISGYSGDANDGMTDAMTTSHVHDGMQFSTFDKDNDIDSSVNNAQKWKGAWWYSHGHNANLNGEYGNNLHGEGINWRFWKGWTYSLKTVRMMLRKP